MTADEFERIIADTLDQLPASFQKRLENVEIVLEEYPDASAMRLAGVTHPEHLLGLYHGIPLTERTAGYNMVAPDKISIYRQPLLRHYRSPEQLRDGIKHTVLHELAHYFGIDDERLREIGAY